MKFGNAIVLCGLVLMAMTSSDRSARADDSKEKAAAVKEVDGKYFDAEGNPTFKIQDDGTVDWYTFSGYRRYHSDCHVCHGPDAAGSSYAPALADSLKTMTYEQFQDVVVNGRKISNSAKQSVMPSFGTNQNVMCHLDDLYIYLRARADGALERGRPAKKEPKNDAARASESQCLGVKS